VAQLTAQNFFWLLIYSDNNNDATFIPQMTNMAVQTRAFLLLKYSIELLVEYSSTWLKP